MNRALIGLYSAGCYILSMLVIVYAIFFVGDMAWAPRTVNRGPDAPLATALIVDGLLLGLFALQHSVMARPAFKALLTRMLPKPAERSTYVLAASAVLIATYVLWRPINGVVWATSGPLAWLLWAFYFAGWAGVVASTFLISHFDLFGLKQGWDNWRGRMPGDPRFYTPGPYRFIRHPLYVGFLVAFWAAPLMTYGRLLFAAAVTGYILIAIQLEEHDLIDVFGDQYRAYRRTAGMLWPRFGSRPSSPS